LQVSEGGLEKTAFYTAKKGNPAKQSFTQSSKKLDKLKKAIKKFSAKSKKQGIELCSIDKVE
jgi:hypothetical protein